MSQTPARTAYTYESPFFQFKAIELVMLCLFVIIAGFALGWQAGANDTWAQVGLYEDGSYSSGCRPGGLCERP